MKAKKEVPKAFIGAAISVGTQVIGGIIGGAKKRKAERAERLRQERLQSLQSNQDLATNQNENMLSQEEKDSMLNEYYATGGKTNKNSVLSPRRGNVPNIASGGKAIPIKKDTYLLKGRKHSAGGIVIGEGKNSIEAEADEVVQVSPKQLKIFSAQPILNGNSPAELVQKGVEPNKVFNAQEEYKDRKGLNNDGTKKKNRMKNGGVRDRFPVHSGIYDGKNEAKAIKGLREIRNNPKYQYDGKDNTVSTPSLNNRLAPLQKKASPIKSKETPKKQSFNSAFRAARKSGLKVFEWNGKKYGTQLASEVTNKVATKKVESSAPKKVESSTPKKETVSTASSNKVKTIERTLPEVVIATPKKQPVKTKQKSNLPISEDATKVGNKISAIDIGGKTYYRRSFEELEAFKNKVGKVISNKNNKTTNKNNKTTNNTAKSIGTRMSSEFQNSVNNRAVGTNDNYWKKRFGYKYGGKAKLGLGKFLKNNSGELLSAGVGAIGSIASGIMNKSSIKNIKAPSSPRLVSPARLKTSVNVNPQLSNIKETEKTTNRNIASNTSSSAASLARQQRVSNSSLQERNRIRGEKENIETQLLNQSAMNRQTVNAQNASTINSHRAIQTQTENEKIQALANNRTQMISGITSAARDYQTGMDIKRRDRLSLAAEMSKNPEQVDAFEANMDKNIKRLDRISNLYKCGGKRKLKK